VQKHKSLCSQTRPLKRPGKKTHYSKEKTKKTRKQNLYTRHDGESLVAEGVTLGNEKEQKNPQNKTGKQ
jgi:hypothetical protein